MLDGYTYDPTTPVIFLDFDGVLNSDRWTRDQRERGIELVFDEQRIDEWLDPAAVAILNALCEETGAALVLSTSWVVHYCEEWLREVLASVGVTASIIDVTDRDHWTRVERILAWVERYQPRDWCALDDCPSIRSPLMRQRGVKTDPKWGLTHRDTISARRLLQGTGVGL